MTEKRKRLEFTCMKMLLAVLFLCPILVPAQIQEQWVYIKQGQGNGADIVEEITVDQTGDIYAAGWTFPTGYTDTVFTVIKLRSNDGIEDWEFLYDGSGNRMNKALSICIDTISAFAPAIYAAGYSWNTSTDMDFTVIKLDTTDGNMIWDYVYDGPGSGPTAENYDCARAITIDTIGGLMSEGGPVIAGYSGQSDGFGVAYTVIGLNFDSPTSRWIFTDEYAVSPADDIAQDIVTDNNGFVYSTGVYVVPATNSEDITTIKHRADMGIPEWKRHYLYTPPPPFIDWERGEAITVDTNSGDVYTAGNIAGGSGQPMLMPAVIKYNSEGTFQWIWNDDNYSGVFRDVVVGNSGYVYATGSGFLVLKLDPSTGNPIHIYTGTSGSAYSMAIDDEENIYITGSSFSDIAIVKLDSTLSEQWVYTYNGLGNGDDCAYSIVFVDSANIYVGGYTTGSGTGKDFTVIKIETIIGIEESQIRNPQSQILQLAVYPNPFKQMTEIRLQMTDKQLSDISHQSSVSIKIYDASGWLVKNFSLPTAYSLLSTVISWEGTDNNGHKVPAGVYFVRLEAGDYKETEKVIIVR
jgi:hypothetical protein